MPRYIIHCSTTRSYHLVVEAPNKDSVHAYYEESEGDEFWPGDEGCWSFNEICEIPDNQSYPTTDVHVNAEGETVPAPATNKE